MLGERFEVLSAESYSVEEESVGEKGSASAESVVLEGEEVSEAIKELILEEKRRNFISKTEQFYEPAHLKRCHSASLIHRRR